MKKRTALLAAAIASTLPSVALADNYSIVNFLSPTHATTLGQIHFADEVKRVTDGKISFEVFPGGSLLPANGALGGIRDGIAEGGYIAGTYFPSELQVTNVFADLGWAAPDALLMAIASTDFNINYEPLQEEWKRNGIVPLSGYGSNPYVLLCANKLETAEDFKGKRIRMPGGAWDRFATHIGAVAVNVPSSELYVGLERGLIDCAVNGVDALATFSLWDVVDGVNMIPLGTYFSGVNIGINREFWAAASTEHRQAMIDAAAMAVVTTQAKYAESEKGALDAAAGHDVAIIEPNDEFKKVLADFIEADVDNIKQLGVERFKVANADEVVNEFLAVVGKWKTLLEGVDRTDSEAVAALVKKEIFDPLNADEYGMN